MSLVCLPTEILREVSRLLDFRDVINLAASELSMLIYLLGDDSICKDLVEQHIPLSREARLAEQGRTTYRKALLNAFARREAFATAQPYSIRVLGQASTFCYANGTLCYLKGNLLRVLDVHNTASTELVFDLQHVFGSLPNGDGGGTKLLHFQDDVLALLCIKSNEPNRLAALDTRRQQMRPEDRQLFCRKVLRNPLSTAEFVRQGSGYLIYGSYNDGAQVEVFRWQFWAFDLARNRSCELNLGGLAFSTCNINADILFEVVGKYFYIATSQITEDHEGSDPTSYFGGCRFNLHDEPPKAEYWRIWRRQHREGAIHDLWTDLSLKRDENKQLLLLETRREWQPGNALPLRTFYTQPLRFEDDEFGASFSAHQSQPLPHDDDDKLRLRVSRRARLIPAESEQVFVELDEDQSPASDPASNRSDDEMADYDQLDGDDGADCSHYRHHLDRYTHREYPGSPDSTLEFSSTATKYRMYNPASHAFLDLVSLPAAASSAPLRLRIGSCIAASPLDEHTGRLRQPALDEASGRPIRGSEERLVNRGVQLWPRGPVPAAVEELMRSTGSHVEAVADERGVVFAGALGLVLVNFDPAAVWAVEGTEQLPADTEWEPERAEGPEQLPRQAHGKESEADGLEEQGDQLILVREEQAEWIRENKLIRLR